MVNEQASANKGAVRAANVDVARSAGGRPVWNHERLQPDFRSSLSNLRNPYGEGDAAPKIVKVLKHLNEMPSLIQKKTYQGR